MLVVAFFRRSSEMKVFSYLSVLILIFVVFPQSWAGDTIPKAAWRRPLGLPLEKAGVTRVPGNIDDGYWQGAPVGGFGSGTFPEATAAISPGDTSRLAFISARFLEPVCDISTN